MRLLLFLGIALAVGLTETGQLLLRGVAEGRSPGVLEALVLTLPRWILLAALAPAVRALAEWQPIERDALPRAVPLHLGFSILFALAHLVLCVIVYGFLLEGAPNRVPFRLTRLVTVYFAGDVLIYWGMLGAFSAVRYQRASREREIAASRLEAGLSESRLAALRAQLNPHFLFNTLNATVVMARKGDHSAVVSMLGSLSDLLRLTLDRSVPHEVPLARELAALDAYLAIQRARFGDRLEVIKAIAPDALDALVPSLLLQPLVENAVQHGIAARPGPGRIAITAERVGDVLRVEVRDSGPGFPGPEASPARSGIGLENTRARLEHLYGARHALRYGKAPEGGALVAIDVPYRTEDAERTAAARGVAP